MEDILVDISIVIPVLNEEESISELVEWISNVLKTQMFSYEILFVDDGSTDNTWNVICDLQKKHPEISGIKFRKNYGKSAALNTAFKQCKGDVVITMDGDLQDSPEEIPELYRLIKQEQYDIVSGWKKIRHDNTITKNIPSKIYNNVTSLMSGIKLHDMNCGLKAYRGEVVHNIELFSEMHRYIPVIAKIEGFNNIGEKVVKHQKRKYGVSKFGVSRFVYGFLDLATILFIGKFGKRPMHFYGTGGIITFFIGFMFVIYLAYTKYFCGITGITNRPAFFLALVAMVIGSLMFLTGFLAELIIRSSNNKTNPKVKSRI